MKKIISVCLFFVIMVFAEAEPVITFKHSFNAVKVNKPAISKTVTCITRVMLNEGLLDNGACEIEEVYVMNNKNFYIGTLATSIPPNSYGTYLDYDDAIGRYKGKGRSIKVKYTDIEPEDATEYNMNLVSCPKGTKPYIDGNAFSCKTPYACPKNMYAYDEFTCYELPDNAIRLTTEGFTCKKGYISVNNSCEEIVTCDTSMHYNKIENACYTKAVNSHWVSETEWVCDSGFVDIGDNCEKQITCPNSARYDSKTNSCIYTPENAHWNTAFDYTWECNTGYIQIYNHCEKRNTCLASQKYDEYSNTCENPPENASWDYFGNVRCNIGYVLQNEQCEPKAICEKYDLVNNRCFEKPMYSHWNNKDTLDNRWSCDDDYVKRFDSCEPKADCGWGERYDEVNNTCVRKPKHSSWLNSIDTRWTCDTDYWFDGDRCIENYHPSILSRMPDVNMNIRLGGIFNMGFDSTTVSELSVGFKAEPGIDIGMFRAGLDGELNFGVIDAPSQAKRYFSSDDERVELAMLNSKIGLTLYIQGENLGLFVEPYIVIPIAIDTESAQLTDNNFTYSSDLGAGFRGGIRIFGNHQIAFGYEDSGIKIYNQENKRFMLTYSIMWQSENR